MMLHVWSKSCASLGEADGLRLNEQFQGHLVLRQLAYERVEGGRFLL